MISSVRLATASPLPSQPPAAPAAAPAPAAPTAPRKTPADYSLPRKAVEGTFGLVGGFVGSAVNALPSAFAGGVEGVARNNDASDVGTALTVFLVIETTAGGIAAGALAGGPIGAAIGAGAGLVGGILFGSLQQTGKGAKQLGAAIKDKVDPAVADNQPSGSKTRDVSKDFSEGAIVGGIAGTRAGFSVGAEESKGVASGLIEGAKGLVGVITNRWEPAAAAKNHPDRKGVVGIVLGIPRVLLGTALGAASGVAGAALETIDGGLQGLGEGADHHYNGSKSMHRFVLKTELLATGIGAGAVVAGPLGALVGAVGGLVVGVIVSKMQKKTGSDQEIVDCIARNVEGAAQDNATGASPIYVAFRDAVEGTIVGGAAGAKAGFVSGFEGGKGAVDGVFDGIKGVIDGILGAFGGSKPQPQQPPQQPGQPQQPAQHPPAPPAPGQP